MYKTALAHLVKSAYTNSRKQDRERRLIGKMTDNRMMDLDDMIFADCEWQPSER